MSAVKDALGIAKDAFRQIRSFASAAFKAAKSIVVHFGKFVWSGLNTGSGKCVLLLALLVLVCGFTYWVLWNVSPDAFIVQKEVNAHPFAAMAALLADEEISTSSVGSDLTNLVP